MNACGRGAHRAFVKSRLTATVVAASLAVSLGAGMVATQASAFAVARSQPRDATSFWTPARMKRAKPLEARRQSASGPAISPAPALSAETPHRVPPRAPRAEASASSTFGEVPDPTVAGLRQNGVIFFVAAASSPAARGPRSTLQTSASSSRPATASTAAAPRSHLRGLWVFVPGYRFGQRPSASSRPSGSTRRGWLTTGSENFDVGAAVVARNESGQRLADAVGGAGIAWGLKAARCSTSTATRWRLLRRRNPAPLPADAIPRTRPDVVPLARPAQPRRRLRRHRRRLRRRLDDRRGSSTASPTTATPTTRRPTSAPTSARKWPGCSRERGPSSDQALASVRGPRGDCLRRNAVCVPGQPDSTSPPLSRRSPGTRASRIALGQTQAKLCLGIPVRPEGPGRGYEVTVIAVGDTVALEVYRKPVAPRPPRFPPTAAHLPPMLRTGS